MTTMFLVRCPQCGNSMKYQVMQGTYFGKTKKCVYCGKTFQVKDYVIKRIK